MQDDDVREGNDAVGHGAPVATSQVVPEVKEEEWKLQEFGFQAVIWFPDGKASDLMPRREASDIVRRHSASIQRVLEKASTLSDNVKAQPEQGEKPTQLFLCEIPQLILHENQLYIFQASPGCKGCADYLSGKKEAVADSVEAQKEGLGETDVVAKSVERKGQNELLPCPFCGGTPRQLHGSHLVTCDNLDCPLATLMIPEEWNKRAAIFVSDGGGSDAMGVSSPKSSVSANAQGPMEGWEVKPKGKDRDLDHPFFTVFADEKSNVPLASFPNEHWAREWRHKYIRTGDIRVEIRRFSDLNDVERHALEMYAQAPEKGTDDLPSLIKEQPAKQDYIPWDKTTQEHYEALEAELGRAKIKLADLEEKEAVTRNTAVLQMARQLIDRLDLIHADARYKSIWFTAANHGDAYGGPKYDKELKALRRTVEKAEQELLSEADGQPESASGASSKGKPFGYDCPVCSEPIDDSQDTRHTDQGLAHADCCETSAPSPLLDSGEQRQ